MSDMKPGIESRPIGVQDFDERGDSFWGWALIPVLMLLVPRIVDWIGIALGFYIYDPMSLSGIIFAVVQMAAAVLFLVVGFTTIANRSKPREGANGGAIAIGLTLILVLAAGAGLIQGSAFWIVQAMGSDYRFDPIAGFELLPEVVGGLFTNMTELRFTVAAVLLLILLEVIYRGVIVGGLLQAGASGTQAILTGTILPAVVVLLNVVLSGLAMLWSVMFDFGYVDFGILVTGAVSILAAALMGFLMSWLRTSTRRFWPCLVVTLAIAPVYILGRSFFIPAWE